MFYYADEISPEDILPITRERTLRHIIRISDDSDEATLELCCFFTDPIPGTKRMYTKDGEYIACEYDKPSSRQLVPEIALAKFAINMSKSLDSKIPSGSPSIYPVAIAIHKERFFLIYTTHETVIRALFKLSID